MTLLHDYLCVFLPWCCVTALGSIVINPNGKYVSGGNTFYLLQELKRTGADLLLLEQIEHGKSTSESLLALSFLQNTSSMRT